jgi:hypothetical protein
MSQKVFVGPDGSVQAIHSDQLQPVLERLGGQTRLVRATRVEPEPDPRSPEGRWGWGVEFEVFWPKGLRKYPEVFRTREAALRLERLALELWFAGALTGPMKEAS